jgi:Fe-Mn family superoxide dismutase
MKKHTLPQLPYSYDALEPYIDARTMEIHHTKHHQTYVDKLNLALEKYPNLFDLSLEKLLSNIDSVPQDIRQAVINHGGGHYNHSLFWNIMGPNTKKTPTGRILVDIEKKWGSFDNFKNEFTKAAVNLFGSGWAWLVIKNGYLEICTTSNQNSVLMENKFPLLGIDVWEHAYYLKYQNKRQDYVEAWWNVVDWQKVEERYINKLG